MKSILDFARARQARRPIVLIAAYDALMARILGDSDADAILVGDSVAMVVHGFPTTVHATVPMISAHVAAVRRGAPGMFVVADMPFTSVRKGIAPAVEAAAELMQSGANAVKIEGIKGHEDVVSHLVESGIPVMGHLGLTPQSVNQFGGNRVQGRDSAQAAGIRMDAERLQAAGAFSLVLECVPAELAAAITVDLAIPTIGIGAGPDTSGQVLVLSDLLGLDNAFHPSFVRRYADGHGTVLAAVNAFARDVRGARFPAREEVPA